MLKYSDVETYLSTALTSLGYDPLPVFDPGPGSDQNVQDTTPDPMVIITLTPGAGLDSEETFDRAGLQIRAIGPQQDYDGAETLAQDIDRALLARNLPAQSRLINGKWTLSIVRTGGQPSLLLQDDGDRYHFTCNYIWEVVY